MLSAINKSAVYQKYIFTLTPDIIKAAKAIVFIRQKHKAHAIFILYKGL